MYTKKDWILLYVGGENHKQNIENKQPKWLCWALVLRTTELSHRHPDDIYVSTVHISSG